MPGISGEVDEQPARRRAVEMLESQPRMSGVWVVGVLECTYIVG